MHNKSEEDRTEGVFGEREKKEGRPVCNRRHSKVSSLLEHSI